MRKRKLLTCKHPWTIASEENCPQVRVKVWVRFSARTRVWGAFLSGAVVLEPFQTSMKS